MMSKGFVTTTKTPRNRCKGFTVIELIIAIIILAVLASLSVNFMGSYKIRENMSSASQLFLNAFTTAGTLAQKNNSIYSVLYNSTSRVVKVCKGTTKECNDSDAEYLSDLTKYSNVNPTWEGGDTVNLSVGDVYFTPFGRIVFRNKVSDTIYFVDNANDVDVCIGFKFIGNAGSTDNLYEAKGDGGC